MKVPVLNNVALNTKTQLKKRNNNEKYSNIQNDVNFGAGASNASQKFHKHSKKIVAGLIAFWAAVARGGLFADFTIQDNLGTNIPRTLGAAFVGREYNDGKINWDAVKENGLREYLTGPSMFLVPGLVLGASAKFGGKAHSVDVSSISDMSKITGKNFQKYDLTDVKKFKEGFYTDVLHSVFSNFDNLQGEDVVKGIDVDKYVKDIIKMEGAQKKGFIKNLMGTAVDGSRQDLMQSIIEQYTKDKKAFTTGFPDFLTAKFTPNSKEINFEKMLEQMDKYADDLFNTFKKSGKEALSPEFITEFANKRMGGRFVTNLAMGAFTAAFMMMIPKIYTIGKANPETSSLKQWSVNQQAQIQGGNQANQTQEGGNKNNEVSFSGGLSTIGQKIAPEAQSKLSKFASKIESDWINVARPVFLVLITGFTLIPRVLQSTKRDIQTAKDLNQPNDWSETKNILRRDVVTIITILSAMKGLSSIMTHSASKKSGLVLTNKILPKDMNPLKKFVEFFNPEGGVKALTPQQNRARLSDFDNGNILYRMFEGVQEEGGSIKKLLEIDKAPKDGSEPILYKAAKELFGEEILNKNKIEASDLKDMLTNTPDDKKDALKNLLNILNDKDKNPLLYAADAPNGIFQTISLGLVSAFLGFGLPKINETINKRSEEKKLAKMKEDFKNTPQQTTQTATQPSQINTSVLNNMTPEEEQVFSQFLK